MISFPSSWQELALAQGSNPITAFIYILKHGGLIVIYPMMVFMLIEGWLEWIRERVKHHRKFVLLAIDVPKDNEQSMKAIEQIYGHIYGAKKAPAWYDKWWNGWTQAMYTFEIESDGGYIQFYARTWEKHQDLVEAAIYAQYPDAEIKVVDKKDWYNKKLTVKMIEDGSHDLYGSELKLEAPDIFPIKHWAAWEHALVGKFIDPMAALLEIMSRMQPGEHVWIQMMIQPTELGPLGSECQKEIDKITGDKKKEKPHTIDKILEFPLKIVDFVVNEIFGGEGGSTEKAEEASKRIFLVEFERETVTELDTKRSYWPYNTKIRWFYWAKKDLFNFEKGRRGMMGAFRQFRYINNFVEGRWTKVDLDDSFWFDQYYQPMKQTRMFWRKRKLIWNYSAMDMDRGEHHGFRLNIKEIASFFHFPQIDVRAPFVQKAENKRFEPPTQLDLTGKNTQGNSTNVKMQAVTAESDQENDEIPSPVPKPEEPKMGSLVVHRTPEQIAYFEELKRRNDPTVVGKAAMDMAALKNNPPVQQPEQAQPIKDIQQEPQNSNDPPDNIPFV